MAIHETQNVKVVIFCHNSSCGDYLPGHKASLAMYSGTHKTPARVNKPKPASIVPPVTGGREIDLLIELARSNQLLTHLTA